MSAYYSSEQLSLPKSSSERPAQFHTMAGPAPSVPLDYLLLRCDDEFSQRQRIGPPSTLEEDMAMEKDPRYKGGMHKDDYRTEHDGGDPSSSNWSNTARGSGSHSYGIQGSDTEPLPSGQSDSAEERMDAMEHKPKGSSATSKRPMFFGIGY